MDFFLCSCSYLLYITQLINNQEMKPHQYSVYIKSVTMHPVPAFNKARYGSFEFSLGIYRYIPGFEFSWKYRCIPRFPWKFTGTSPVLSFPWEFTSTSHILSFSWEFTGASDVLSFPWEFTSTSLVLSFPGKIPLHPRVWVFLGNLPLHPTFLVSLGIYRYILRYKFYLGIYQYILRLDFPWELNRFTPLGTHARRQTDLRRGLMSWFSNISNKALQILSYHYHQHVIK